MYVTRPDSYVRIKDYAAKFATLLKEKTNNNGLSAPTADEEVFAVLMEKGDVARLLLHPKCHKLTAIIGVAEHNGKEEVTISLLAVGADGKVLPEHMVSQGAAGTDNKDANQADFTGDPLPGEEVWPVRKTIAEMNEFLP